MHQVGKVEIDKCLACLYIVENDWHIISCPKILLGRETLLKALTETL
jgi:hypothetical protein